MSQHYLYVILNTVTLPSCEFLPFNLFCSPVMIEIAGRLAGGRKAIMAEATISGWHPFDAMVDAHCGFPVRMPPSFRPKQKAVQVYVPSDKNGIVKSFQGHDFSRFSTYNDSMLLKRIGQKVTKARDLMSFAAFVWLIGDEDDVLREAKLARDQFKVEIKDDDEENGERPSYEE